METESKAMLATVEQALESGDAAGARQLIESAWKLADFSPVEWEKLKDIGTWCDQWLVAAIRLEPPDPAALDELVQRYWKPLFGRCMMLTLNREEASDLAQEAWLRVLKARHNLDPKSNFPGYLNAIAMNFWRDRYRSERRAGELGGNRMVSLNAEYFGEEGEGVVLGDVVPDLNALEAGEQAMRAMDLDEALGRLAPILRGVLIARFLLGESCAEIGRRYGRTEQTISGWVRQGVAEMKTYFSDSAGGKTLKNVP